MKYGKPILALLSLVLSRSRLRLERFSKRIADCYMFIVIDVRCLRISTSGFTSWLHDVLHCLVFKEHPRFPPARCAFRESASIYYLIRFGLSSTFRIYFRKLSAPSGIRLPAAFALVAVCRRLVIYYTVVATLSTLISHFYKKFPIHYR